jgi:cytochrome P450
MPSKDPIFGLDNLYVTIQNVKEHKFLERGLARFNELGNTMATRRLFQTIIITRDPQNIKTILSLRFKDYGLGQRFKTFGSLLGHGIFTTDGEHWAQSRAMIRPNFVREQVADLAVFEAQMADLIELIPKDGSAVDLQDLFFSYTIDSATEFLFGQSVESLKKRRSGGRDAFFENDFASAFNYAQHAIATRIRLGPLFRFYRDRKAEQCNRVCHALVEQFVDKALEVRAQGLDEKTLEDGDGEKKQRYVFLHGLAQQTGDRRRIRDEVMNVLLAGRDTTASLLSNLFFMLAKHPRIWAKLRDEVASLNGRPPTYEQLRNLTYVKYCLNECTYGTLKFICAMLTPRASPSSAPRRPWKRPLRQHRHRPPRWRRAGRPIPHFRPQGCNRHVQRVVDAPPRGLLRPRCERVPSGALGRSPAGMGVSPVQRGPAHLRGTAVCAYRGRVRDGAAGAAVCGAGESGSRPVGGEFDPDLVFEKWDQGELEELTGLYLRHVSTFVTLFLYDASSCMYIMNFTVWPNSPMRGIGIATMEH